MSGGIKIMRKKKKITGVEFKEISGEWKLGTIKENKHVLKKQMLSEMQKRFFE